MTANREGEGHVGDPGMCILLHLHVRRGVYTIGSSVRYYILAESDMY
jgi:hypothetical protein